MYNRVFKVFFTGRRIGSEDRCVDISELIFAMSAIEARIQLYESYELITGVTILEVERTPNGTELPR